MKKTTNFFSRNRNFLLLIFILFNLAPQLKADCTFGNINSNTNPLAGCTGIVTITGRFTISTSYNVNSIAPGITEIRISGATADIYFTGNNTLTLPTNSNLVFLNGAILTTSCSCNSNQRVVIGSQVASCNGNGSGVTTGFTQVNAADVFSMSGTLPIDLLSFAGKQTANGIALQWETASEQNNAYIAIERSKDGVHFVEIDQKKGYGTTSEPKQYNWTDPTPLQGINYYRLRQADYDGKFEYHPIIAVEFNGKAVQSGIRLYPTEVKDRVQIILNQPVTDNAVLYVVDMSGRILQRQKIAAGTLQHELTLNTLPAGSYMVSLQVNNTIQTARFIKL